MSFRRRANSTWFWWNFRNRFRITPLLMYAWPFHTISRLHLTHLQSPTDCLEKQTQQLSIRNDSGLPLTCLLELVYPFSLLDSGQVLSRQVSLGKPLSSFSLVIPWLWLILKFHNCQTTKTGFCLVYVAISNTKLFYGQSENRTWIYCLEELEHYRWNEKLNGHFLMRSRKCTICEE